MNFANHLFATHNIEVSLLKCFISDVAFLKKASS